MNNNQKVALLVALLIACVGVVFFGARSNSTSPANNLKNNVEEIAAENPLRLDLASLSGPYKVTLETTGDQGGDITASADVDARGNIRTTIKEQNVDNVFVYVDGVTYVYVSADDSWIKFGGGADARSPFSADDISVGYSKEDIENLTKISQGSDASCNLGTCRIYTAKNPDTDEDVIIKVENSTDRLSDLELANTSGKKTVIAYRYNEAVSSVEPPEQYKEFYTSGTEGVSPQ